jgi:hypothetical protein
VKLLLAHFRYSAFVAELDLETTRIRRRPLVSLRALFGSSWPRCHGLYERVSDVDCALFGYDGELELLLDHVRFPISPATRAEVRDDPRHGRHWTLREGDHELFELTYRSRKPRRIPGDLTPFEDLVADDFLDHVAGILNDVHRREGLAQRWATGFR